MNWTIEYIKNPNFVKIVTEGDFSVSDHLEMIKDITSQKFWKPGTDTFFDNRKLEFNETTVELMKKVSENHKEYEAQIGDGKAAILMKSLEDYLRGRQFALLTSPQASAKMNIFMDEAEALKWLTS
jgi:hypothetical protein